MYNQMNTLTFALFTCLSRLPKLGLFIKMRKLRIFFDCRNGTVCEVCRAYTCIYCVKVAFCTLKQYRDWKKPEADTMPYSYFEWLQRFFIVHSAIDSTVHSMPLNNLEHFMCTTTLTNILPNRDSNLVYGKSQVDTNEPSGPASLQKLHNNMWHSRLSPGQ